MSVAQLPSREVWIEINQSYMTHLSYGVASLMGRKLDENAHEKCMIRSSLTLNPLSSSSYTVAATPQ